MTNFHDPQERMNWINKRYDELRELGFDGWSASDFANLQSLLGQGVQLSDGESRRLSEYSQKRQALIGKK